MSGPRARAALEALGGRAPPPRRAAVTTFRDPAGGATIDRGVALWFAAPASYTGEDVAELHVHGGPAVVAAMLAALARIDGLRPAEAGEFTRRAFANGKLDLTQVEALADLIAADTEAQRRQAQRQLEGALGALYGGWRARLVRALAHLEAAIDFPEEDLPPSMVAALGTDLGDLAAEIARHLDDARRGERLRAGFLVAIVGAPNVGKSSLLNRLGRRDAAIVDAAAGTTRDVVEVGLDIGGFPVTLADTAGLRDAAGAVESEGVRRALARAAAADLKLALFSAPDLERPDRRTLDLIDDDTIVLVNKVDLAALPADLTLGGRETLGVSARTGHNIEVLAARLAAEIGARHAPGAAPAITRARHRTALERCAEAIARCRRQLDGAAPAELAAEDLRLATRALGRITGEVDVEDILDVVFADFCIGK